MGRAFQRSFNKLLELEGVYSDHPSDSGGETKYGVTEETAKSAGYKGDMKDLPKEKAGEIYQEIWDRLKLDKVSSMSESIAFQIFEFAVHSGDKISIKFFQRALNAFNKDGEIFDDLKVDGIIGEKTLKAFEDYHFSRLNTGGDDVLLSAINGQQASYYIRLTEENKEFEQFVYGWIRHRT